MFLQLNIKIIFAKDIDIPAEAVIGFLLASVHEQLWHLGAQATGGADQPLSMFRQELMIDARFIIVAVELAMAGNLEQVAIASHVAGEQQDVIVLTIQLPVAPAHRSAPDGLVGFNADNRLDLILFAGAEKFNGAMHDAMIGERQRRLPQPLGLFYQLFDAAQAVEHRIFRVNM